jgi:hypothetical protein
VSVVQVKSGSVSPASSLTVTFDSATTSGNSVVAVVSCYYDGAGNAGTPWSVDDNNSNTFQSSGHGGSGASSGVEVFSTIPITGRSGHAVTAHAGVSTYLLLTIYEVSPLDATTPPDVQTSAFNSPVVEPFASGNITPTSPGDVLLIGLTHYYSTAVTITPNAGWATPDVVSGGGLHIQSVCTREVHSTAAIGFGGSYSSTPTFGDTVYIAALKLASGGGGGATGQPTMARWSGIPGMPLTGRRGW